MKKGYIRGVLTCDPSWRGLAFTIHVPSFNYNDSCVMDMAIICKENRKKITQPMVYIPIAVIAIEEFIKKRPMVRLCDKLIIESQFSENMKILSNIITTILLTKFQYMKVEKMSPITCKNKHSVPYGDGHYSNKKRMLEYVNKNKDKLIAGDTVQDHNTADSIIILNTWLGLKRRHLYAHPEEFSEEDMNQETFYDVPFELKNTWFECPICGYHSGRVYLCKNPPKDPSRPSMVGNFFISCRNENCRCGPSYFGKTPPVIRDGKIGNVQLGIWKKSDGSKKPPEVQNAVSGYNIIPVEPLGTKRKREQEETSTEEENILRSLVSALEDKQNKLQEKVLEMQAKSEETLSKLLSAITGNSKPIVIEDDKEKPPPKKKQKRQKKFSADDLEDGPPL